MKVGDYALTPYQGLWFLTDESGRTVSTILDMGGGVWRARTPDGEARTFDDIPAGVEYVPRWIAEQITS